MLVATLPLSASVIYNNSTNDLMTRFNPGTLEVGNQIILAGTERYLTNFSFEFWGTNTASPANIAFAGNVEVQVRFYLNDGAPFNTYATPGSNFWSSGWFTLTSPTARNTLIYEAGPDFPSAGLFIPTNQFTWTVQFQGMGGTDSVGVDLYGLPVVGASYLDYWEDSSGWKLMTNSLSSIMSFGATFDASQVAIPEPATPVLAVLAGLGLLTLRRRWIMRS